MQWSDENLSEATIPISFTILCHLKRNGLSHFWIDHLVNNHVHLFTSFFLNMLRTSCELHTFVSFHFSLDDSFQL